MSARETPTPADDTPGFFDHPGRIRAMVYAVYAVCAVLFVADLAYHKHAYTTFEGWFGFHAWFAFLACVAVALVARVARRVLMRPHTYYESTPIGPEPDDAA